MIERLQTKGVFCCHCLIETSSIKVGILVAPDTAGEVALIDPETKQKYKVKLPESRSGTAYNVELTRC